MLNASFFLLLLFFPEVESLTRLGCEQDLHSLNLAPGGLLIFLKFIYFIYLFLAALVLRCCVRLSLVVASEGYSSLRCAGFLLQWLLLLRSTGSRCVGFSSCGMRAQQLQLMGSREQAQQLWRTGLVTPRHVGSSQTRAQTCVPCTGRRILKHCATREA